MGRKPDLSGVDERIGRPWEHAHKGLHSHSYTEDVKPVSFTKVIIFIFFLIKGFISVFVKIAPTICKYLFSISYDLHDPLYNPYADRMPRPYLPYDICHSSYASATHFSGVNLKILPTISDF